MKRILSLLVVWFLLLIGISSGIELVRQKNVATIVTFPIIDNDGDTVSSAAGLDSEIDTWSDGAAPDGFTDCTNEATEVGSTGIYYLSLTQAEMNVDYSYIQIKTTTTDAKTQHILIRTQIGDPLLYATTDDGGVINVTGGAVDTVTTTTTATTATTCTNLTNAPSNGDFTSTMKTSLNASTPASIQGTVGSVTGNIGGNVVGSVGSVTGNVGGNVTGSVGSLATQAKADVNAEMVDALITDTYGEPTGVPLATASIKDKLGWLFALSRNKITQTSTTTLLRNDADNGTIGTSSVSDDGTTFIRGEYQ
jgi:hypothetical protein